MEKRRQALDAMTPQMREVIAENMKERVYATITLLAVIAALWQTSAHHSVRGAVLTIAGTVVALFFATLISARMSYRAVHNKSIEPKQYQHVIFTTSGLLAPALTPILIVLGSLTHWYDLKAALMASMVVLLISLFLLSFNAGRRIYDSTGRLLIVSFLEMSVGLGVILLKLAVGE